jgi:hypothetical protein
MSEFEKLRALVERLPPPRPRSKAPRLWRWAVRLLLVALALDAVYLIGKALGGH